jgi:hypothetical protein
MRRLRPFFPLFSLLPLLGIAPDGVPLNVAVAGNPKGQALLMLHGAYQSYISFIPQFRTRRSPPAIG